MSEHVTGDAVVLELRPARLPSRALAVAIDTVLLWVVFSVLTLVLTLSTVMLDEAARAAVAVASFLLVLVGGPVAVETLSRGRSLGKLACGLRVVREDGGPIRFRHALVRGAMGVVELLLTFGVVAAISSLVSARGRRLGDVFAGTLVVRERVPADRSRAMPPLPPWLAGRFTQLDLSAVPDEFWFAARQYLSRLHQLDPDVRQALGTQLAGELVARTAVSPPEEVPPAAYLAAVLHERREREARRMRALPYAVGPAGDGGLSAPAPAGPGPTGGPTAGRGVPTVPPGRPSAGAVVGAPGRGAGATGLPIDPEKAPDAPAPRTGFAPPA
ncbi:RDD family protein [Streptomyces sp. NBC_01218]|uniref:RDD family protein n=1 Tax=Streptomyces sp. NBC_01218 TaxID=2903780 RepID=UPI002E125C19|nr:RDD family protein [Streptomyces sp. NBC_01218]